MIEREERVAAVIDAAGGKVIGRVRMQKIFYLLDQLGFDSGFDFEYHHYGPYSRDLDNAIGDAKAFDLIKEETQNRANDGVRYSIFKLSEGFGGKDEVFEKMPRENVQQQLKLFDEVSITVLELAATIRWLVADEAVSDWRAEIVRRKGVKTENGRLEKAISLLKKLDLAPVGA